MPIYTHLFNAVFLKKSIDEKFPGGLPSFKTKNNLPEADSFIEDNELINLITMDPFCPKQLEENLGFTLRHNVDFILIERYGGFPEVENNKIAVLDQHRKRFLWLISHITWLYHISRANEQFPNITRVQNMTMDEISKEFDNGRNPFEEGCSW